MRIKEDPGAYHVSGLIRRDAQHDKSSAEEAKPRSKKDTKKWCKGKVGRPHKGQWRSWDDVNHNQVAPRHGRNTRVLVCVGCGKHLEMCWSWMGKKCAAENHGHSVPAVDD